MFLRELHWWKYPQLGIRGAGTLLKDKKLSDLWTIMSRKQSKKQNKQTENYSVSNTSYCLYKRNHFYISGADSHRTWKKIV